MIVKNESKIIERCLNGAKSIIDYVSICDTGSTDQTVEIIEDWCKKNNMPCTVHREPFKNFGYNRTLSAELAQKTYPESDYLLLLDADMILTVEPHFDKRALAHDQYLTPQSDGHLKYWLKRLLKTSIPWKSVGVTHEYWDLNREKLELKNAINIGSTGKLDGLMIQDQADGGSRADKFERDKRLLLEGISDPTTPPYLIQRYMFYLAQTYSCLNEHEQSIHWYKKRVEAGGWEEEVFYALFQIGLSYERLANNAINKQKVQNSEGNKLVDGLHIIEQLKQQEEQSMALAIFYFQKAWEYRPSRAESLYALARIHRTKSNNNLGLMYALQGKEIPFPKDDILFINYQVYDYLFDYEISICAYYNESKRILGREALKRLQSNIDQLPPDIAKAVESNSKFY
ncbi:glycosyltransferase family 2 protein [Viridibacillus sp. YIM B01967]|uniref:Glycosyltransferase family 2 protein n=2 Tax=Viridibacillus soli TaxID=2798301 RepID=A0ABS1H478_9BACL|nr:glycosyltransferase family 2 protein [Viridibacillus soli]